MTEACGLCSLPDSLLLEIFLYLPVQSLGQLACICTQFNRIVQDEQLWKDIFYRHFRVQRSRPIRLGALSWQKECQRLIDQTPKVLCEELTKHKDQVLHVSFSHNGCMFATSSKDGRIMVWNVDRTCSLRFSCNMTKEFSWRYTQFSQFNISDTLLLVSGVHYGNANTSGEIAVFDLQEFEPQCRVVNKPYDVFGTWYDNSHLLSGTLYWTGNLNSISALWLNKASQALESEKESVMMCLYRFQNVNASSIRTIMVAEGPSENDVSGQISSSACSACRHTHQAQLLKESTRSGCANCSHHIVCTEDSHLPTSLPQEDRCVEEDPDLVLRTEDTLIRSWQKMEVDQDGLLEGDGDAWPQYSSGVADACLDADRLTEPEKTEHLAAVVDDVPFQSCDESPCCDMLLLSHGTGFCRSGTVSYGLSPRGACCFRDLNQKRKCQHYHEENAEAGEPSSPTPAAPLLDTCLSWSNNHAVKTQCTCSNSKKAPARTLREKLMIFTMGEETYTPHLIGIKRIRVEDVIGSVSMRENLIGPDGEMRLLPDVDENLQGLDRPKDSVDHVINMHGHIVGMALSPDHRYLYVNSRQWPQNYCIEKVLEPPPIAQEIDIHVIDLFTLQEVGTIMRSHKAFTPNDECFFLFLDVSDNYVASGAEDKHGYIWDRHYSVCLNRFPHTDVVNSVAFNPQDQEMLVTVSDDFKIKVWRSPHKMREMGLHPVNTSPSPPK